LKLKNDKSFDLKNKISGTKLAVVEADKQKKQLQLTKEVVQCC
jgi:hypothetical protein